MATPNLALPQLAADQAQKHVSVNEALFDLDEPMPAQMGTAEHGLAIPPFLAQFRDAPLVFLKRKSPA